MIQYKEFGQELIEEVYEIYEESRWESYLGDKDKLSKAFENSLYILGAFEDNRLIGFVRCVGDTQYIIYIQDLIVRPDYQRQGIGRELMKRVSDKFPSVRQFVLITDKGDEVSNSFYKAIGMTLDFKGYPINTYFRK